MWPYDEQVPYMQISPLWKWPVNLICRQLQLRGQSNLMDMPMLPSPIPPSPLISGAIQGLKCIMTLLNCAVRWPLQPQTAWWQSSWCSQTCPSRDPGTHTSHSARHNHAKTATGTGSECHRPFRCKCCGHCRSPPQCPDTWGHWGWETHHLHYFVQMLPQNLPAKTSFLSAFYSITVTSSIQRPAMQWWPHILFLPVLVGHAPRSCTSPSWWRPVPCCPSWSECWCCSCWCNAHQTSCSGINSMHLRASRVTGIPIIAMLDC